MVGEEGGGGGIYCCYEHLHAILHGPQTSEDYLPMTFLFFPVDKRPCWSPPLSVGDDR